MSESSFEGFPVPPSPESNNFLNPTSGSLRFLHEWTEGVRDVGRGLVSKPGVATEGTLADAAANYAVNSTAAQTAINLGLAAVVGLRSRPELFTAVVKKLRPASSS